MALRPVERVLLQTLEDIDPEKSERLKAELFDFQNVKTHRSSRTVWQVLERLLVFGLPLLVVEEIRESYVAFPAMLAAILLFYFLEIVEDPFDKLEFRLSAPEDARRTAAKQLPSR